MYDLNKALTNAKGMLDNLGIEYGNVIEIIPNSRAKQRFGQCRIVSRRNGLKTYSININQKLLSESLPYENLMNTVVHELLHTVDGCMNHGTKWKSLAQKVNRKFKLNIKRCSSFEEKGIERPKKNYKWAIKCSVCGRVTKFQRKAKCITYPHRYRCAYCHIDDTLTSFAL